jgi:predicted metalloendopeptidase
MSFFTELAHRGQALLLSVLEEARARASTTHDPVQRVVGTYYGSCLAALQQETPRQDLSQRQSRCFTATDELLSPALGALYTRAILTPPVRAAAERFTTSLHDALAARFAHATWFSDSTRARALRKLATVTIEVGAPPTLPDYASIHLSQTDYAENRRTIQAFTFQQRVKEIHAVTQAEPWAYTPYSLNAQYHWQSGLVEVPAIWWDSSVFDPAHRLAATYGTVGYILSHELSHGFGIVGITQLGPGTAGNWIDPRDTVEFTARSQHLATEISNAPVPVEAGRADTLYFDGQKTLEEDLADLTGVRVAYDAFVHELQQVHARKSLHVPNASRDPQGGAQGGESLTPELTPEQQFFVAYANVWRVKRRNPFDVKRPDPHAPERLRVNIPLSNMPEFARAFGCPLGSPMARATTDRAVVW